jgi:hypothetical protein
LSHDQVALFKTFRALLKVVQGRLSTTPPPEYNKLSYKCAVNYCTVENRSRFTPSNMVLRPLFNTETTLIWYCYHSGMVLRPLKYGVTTILTLSSRNYQYGTTTTQIWWYNHFNFLISPQIEEYWKNIYILLRSFLIVTGHYCSKRDYDLKSTPYSEGTYIIEGTMLLRPFLIPKGHYTEYGLRF